MLHGDRASAGHRSSGRIWQVRRRLPTVTKHRPVQQLQHTRLCLLRCGRLLPLLGALCLLSRLGRRLGQLRRAEQAAQGKDAAAQIRGHLCFLVVASSHSSGTILLERRDNPLRLRGERDGILRFLCVKCYGARLYELLCGEKLHLSLRRDLALLLELPVQALLVPRGGHGLQLRGPDLVEQR
jgi:hypothetical protein